MVGPYEVTAHEIARRIDGWILRFEPDDRRLRVILEVQGFAGVSAEGTSREEAFKHLVEAANAFAWSEQTKGGP